MRKLAFFILFLSAGFLYPQTQPKANQPQPKQPQAQSTCPPREAVKTGRYQIWHNPNIRADTFLLDTETGKIWQRIQYTDLEDDPEVWMIMDRIDSKEDFWRWVLGHPAKSKPAKATP